MSGGDVELDVVNELVLVRARREFDLEPIVLAFPVVLLKALSLKWYQLELQAELAAANGGDLPTGPRLAGPDGRPV